MTSNHLYLYSLLYLFFTPHQSFFVSTYIHPHTAASNRPCQRIKTTQEPKATIPRELSEFKILDFYFNESFTMNLWRILDALRVVVITGCWRRVSLDLKIKEKYKCLQSYSKGPFPVSRRLRLDRLRINNLICTHSVRHSSVIQFRVITIHSSLDLFRSCTQTDCWNFLIRNVK